MLSRKPCTSTDMSESTMLRAWPMKSTSAETITPAAPSPPPMEAAMPLKVRAISTVANPTANNRT